MELEDLSENVQQELRSSMIESYEHSRGAVFDSEFDSELASAQSAALGITPLRYQIATAWGVGIEEIRVYEDNLQGRHDWRFRWYFKEGEQNVGVDYRWYNEELIINEGNGRIIIWQGVLAEYGDEFHGRLKTLITHFLYRMGYDMAPAAYFDELSAHEKMELRLSMPREFWPKNWLDEKEVLLLSKPRHI